MHDEVGIVGVGDQRRRRPETAGGVAGDQHVLADADPVGVGRDVGQARGRDQVGVGAGVANHQVEGRPGALLAIRKWN